MSGKSLKEVLNLEIFRDKKICVDEVLPQNVDFLIVDLSDALGLSISAFSEETDHYRKIAKSRNKQVSVNSAYDGDCMEPDIMDDVWSAMNIWGIDGCGKIQVYRSGTCKKSDWYKYDIVIRVQPLDSGISTDIDGKILIFGRGRKYLELRYKILRDRVDYYTQQFE
ncbi:uncharacterized protein Eint_031190 [Encephalitozoon intestinalis ATCC 50506]|uniref:Uncharacterized protein n=1 Tax=Encephalitozoon intestinalis (strain ATCC 50506) TaxID=876142 RepID=E0S6C7_ENCIT|nr:uncharacterized protein Eint_031190 [Encephalitozoon intestinalis ATCC 50506]ADM11262.1 hypothetical protein Eint_031190 [Encephalitozoon intestinalis ATCC 50506]UTX44930.1 hypothetical protein GPK93_03g04580 [Encephalitozoon intestinalis]